MVKTVLIMVSFSSGLETAINNVKAASPSSLIFWPLAVGRATRFYQEKTKKQLLQFACYHQ